jgi:hypothetical protein
VLGDATSDPDVSHQISIHHRGECWREDWCWLLTFQMDLVGLAYELANGSCNHPVVRYVSTRGAVARQLRNTITKSPPPICFLFPNGMFAVGFPCLSEMFSLWDATAAAGAQGPQRRCAVDAAAPHNHPTTR